MERGRLNKAKKQMHTRIHTHTKPPSGQAFARLLLFLQLFLPPQLFVVEIKCETCNFNFFFFLQQQHVLGTCWFYDLLLTTIPLLLRHDLTDRHC